MSNKPLAVLVDGNNSLYRMYHTQPPRIAGGERIESAAGMIRTINGLSNETEMGKPEVVVAVFDAQGKNFRHEINSTYKANRKGMPDDLRSQEILVKKALSASGIPVIEQAGVEADDVLGMLAHHYVEKGYQVMLVTTDKDMHQVISDDIRLYDPVRRVLRDEEAVVEKFGVKPNQIADYLAIIGDDKDNIMGIAGVGGKTAAKWLKQYGSVDGILANQGDIKGTAGERLRAFADALLEGVQLTTLRSDPQLLAPESLHAINNPIVDHDTLVQLNSTYGPGMSNATTPQKVKKQPAVTKEPDPEPKAEEYSQGMLF